MSSGLLIFLVFLALSVIDSIARTRRGRQAVPPPENGEEPPAGLPAGARKKVDAEEEPEWGLEEFLDLEKLMGGRFPAAQEEEDALAAPKPEPAAAAAAIFEAEPAPAPTPVRRMPGRERRARRAESRPGADKRRARAETQRPQRDATGSRRARMDRESVPLQDSPVSRERRPVHPSSGAAPRYQGRSAVNTQLFRELFGAGDRDALRRAFVLKEVLDAPVSEQPPDQRGRG